MASKKRATLRDVAQLAGVSLGTASRAVNLSGRVSPEAIAAVNKAAKHLSYEPDAIAQSMRKKTTGVIGLLVSEFANPLYARIINAVEERLQARGYALLLANTHNDSKREKAMIDLFKRRRIDGLILGPCESETTQLMDGLLRERFPAIALDRDFGECCSGVHVDHYSGALNATRYLLNLGHRRIAILTSGSSLRPGRERIAGFTDAFAERGLKPHSKLIRSERSSMEFAFSESLALLSSKDSPTAFLCLGTRILSGVLQGLRYAGRSIPDDVSVISIGDTDLSKLFLPSITSLTWDLDAVGTALAELLLKRIDPATEVEAERLVITTELILRESCMPLNKNLKNSRINIHKKAEA